MILPHHPAAVYSGSKHGGREFSQPRFKRFNCFNFQVIKVESGKWNTDKSDKMGSVERENGDKEKDKEKEKERDRRRRSRGGIQYI